MHGDFSRRTFDPTKGYRSVLLQQGRVLLDADVNEQADITAHHDEVRTLDLVGRTGAPVPAGPADDAQSVVGPFAVVGPAATWRTDGAAWSQLRVLPGRYYVDGVLVEAQAGAPDDGWRLDDQPHLSPLAEPAPRPDDGDRYGVFLDVVQHHVTADEDPSLVEPALGGPDTTTRSRTVWQVRVEQVDPDSTCASLHSMAATPRVPRLMTASLEPAPQAASPCEISAVGGYRRLENQLYRVQVHRPPDPAAAAGSPARDGSFLWSRENGSVVGRVLALEPGAVAGTVTLTLDRDARDDDLAFTDGSLVELTSPERALRGEPGFLGTAGPPAGRALPVSWRDDQPTALADAGALPVLRRWEGVGPLSTDPVPLEDGIEVAFPTTGEGVPADGVARTGDHWLLPARTVRLAYGLTQLAGTIDWPRRIVANPDGTSTQVPLPQPPAGPQVHRAALAMLTRTDAGPDAPDVWKPLWDCRELFSPVTAPALDLMGGDGQEALPGSTLPAPVRVALRAGAHPVAGVKVRFTAGTLPGLPGDVPPGPSAGLVWTDREMPTDGDGPLPTSELDVVTDAAGAAEAFWRLDPSGGTTQVLQVDALDADGLEVGTEVQVTGRLSVARQVEWTPPDDHPFPAGATVQEALDRLVRHRRLTLLGGDGQSVRADGQVLAQQVRVLVEDGFGPLAGVAVRAQAGDGFAPGLVDAATADDEAVPAAVGGVPGAVLDGVVTDAAGVARFWWQPSFPGRTSATLSVWTLRADGSPDTPLRVGANLDTGGGAPPPPSGMHISSVLLRGGRPLLDGSVIGVEELTTIQVVLDAEPDPKTTVRSRAVRVELDLPWPEPVAGPWELGAPVATYPVTLGGALDPDRNTVVWTASGPTTEWLFGRLWDGLAAHGAEEARGRLVVDGWSVVQQSDQRARQQLNCHAPSFVADGRLLFDLPTDDATTGGRFVVSFVLRRSAAPTEFTVPDVTGQQSGPATVRLTNLGFRTAVRFQISRIGRVGTVVATDPAPGTTLTEGSQVTLAVAVLFLPGQIVVPGPVVPGPVGPGPVGPGPVGPGPGG